MPKEVNEAGSYCLGSLEKELPVGLRIDSILFNDFDIKRREQAPTVLPMISDISTERRGRRSLRNIHIYQQLCVLQNGGSKPPPYLVPFTSYFLHLHFSLKKSEKQLHTKKLQLSVWAPS
ncbi:MAG: hypothetical protein ACI4I3_05405 [Acutalibacteraceae bacterium]